MPNGYRLNFKSDNPRPTRQANSFAFGAADDGTAEAVAAELANWTGAQQSSLMRNIQSNILGYGDGAYPTGTRLTVSALVMDSTGNVWRLKLRNIKTSITDSALVALFGGTIDLGSGVVPLGAPPILPNSGHAVSAVPSVTINIKG